MPSQRARRRIRDDMLAALKDGDVFVLPTAPIPIPTSGLATIDILAKRAYDVESAPRI